MNDKHQVLNHDLFLLMLNLSQMQNRRQILRIFEDAINSHDIGLHIYYCERIAEGSDDVSYEHIATMHDHFGFFRIEPTDKDIPEENRIVVSNAIRMLAVVLGNNQRTLAIEKERESLARKLQQRNRELLRLATAIEQAAETIIVTDENSIVEYINPAGEAATGYSKSEIIGKSVSILQSLETDPAILSDMQESLKKGKVWKGRLINRRKDGNLYIDDLTITPVYNVEGEVVNYVSAQRDITHEQELENQLRQAQKMEAVGQMAGGVAHDFNNLLQAIQGYTDLALESLPPESEIREDLGEAMKAIDSATSLVRQLLAFSRSEKIEPRNIDLAECINEMLKILRRVAGENVQLKISQDPDLKNVFVDPGHVHQILMNLCVNARDAMPDGGTLTIRIQNVHFESARNLPSGLAPAGSYVLLRVSDTGTGMEKEIQKHIFEPFFSTKESGQGTGLGLATVFGIVKQHNGGIDVVSKRGKGTEFSIYFPASEANQGTDDSQAAEATNTDAKNNEWLLLAEDDEIVRNMTVKVLQRAGYRLIICDNGAEAIEKIMKNRDAISLCLLDIQMPGKNGLAVYWDMRQNNIPLPTIFISGYDKGALRSLDLSAKDLDMIEKPFSPSNILNRIRNLIDKNPRSPDSQSL